MVPFGCLFEVQVNMGPNYCSLLFILLFFTNEINEGGGLLT